ncbi:MAG: S8 family serine peptidase [Bacteroidales bacterium]
MQMPAFKYCILLLSLLLISLNLDAQTDKQRQELKTLSGQLRQESAAEKAAAVLLAKSIGIPVRQELADGRVTELMRFYRGRPMYYITGNEEGAELINSDQVYPGGTAGLNLTGAGQTLGIWDEGKVRDSHREFMGDAESRVTQKDDATNLSGHATHVAGTMIAAGVDAAAKGMSPGAFLDAWDWSEDEAEMATAAAEGLQVSQHSYGYVTGWRFGDWAGETAWHWYGDPDISETEDYLWGFYSEQAADWDEIGHHAPHYLMVKAAGNDRGTGPAAGTEHYVYDPDEAGWVTSTVERELDGGDDGHQSISHAANAKNLMTIGAVDAQKQMASFSGWGPTDDGRIKPDVVAKGVSVYSTTTGSDDSYTYNSGTSMSAPMVSGSVGLLLEHQENLHPGKQISATTVKALILHSADTDISGAPGPDYRFGWGLMNTEAAAGIMSQDASMGGNFLVRELTLEEDGAIEKELYASGEGPLQATIVWTDPPGTPPDPALNPPDLMLVNDLDMRMTSISKTTHEPYILDPANPGNPATTGDNYRDNIEQIHISNPVEGEKYTLSISHKSTLEGGSQDFSLVITGIAPTTFAGNTTEWEDPQNWLYGDPATSEHVFIPATTTHFPKISSTVSVQNLSVEQGASLNISENGFLTVGGHFLTGDESGKRYSPEGKNHSIQHKTNGDVRGTDRETPLNVMEAVMTKGATPIDTGDALKTNAEALVIEPEGSMTVSGRLIHEGGAEGIRLRSDAAATATLIHQTPGVPLTVERHITGDWSTSLSGWHLLSAPVLEQSIADFIPQSGEGDYDFYGWSEPDNLWKNHKATDFYQWNSGENNNGEDFAQDKGYLLSWENTLTPEFAGQSVVSDMGFTNLSLTEEEGDGWHLLGNPFSSAVTWDASAWGLSNIVHTAKIWSNGGYIDITSPGGIIPSMNGFFVQVTDPVNALTIPADSRLHDDTWHKQQDGDIIYLLAKTPDSPVSQQSVIRIEPGTSDTFDPRYDSRFLPGYGPVFHALKNGEELSTISISHTDEDQVIYYHFSPARESPAHEIRLTESTIPGPLYLHDRHHNTLHTLDANNPYLVDNPGETAVDQPRFALYFSQEALPMDLRPEGDAARPAAWYHGGRIYIRANEDLVKLRLFDTQGKLHYTGSPGNTHIQSIPAPTNAGIYFLMIIREQATETEIIPVTASHR